ncbi:MAG: pilus assembly protein PilM [Gammaproteobacteria bacterium]|nr:pilus assembly protein PilM [Gammaproteobacteria bacterium]
MFGLKRKNKPLLGVDISSTSIKLLELSESGSSYRIESYAVEPLPADAVLEKNIQDIEAVSNAIKTAYKKSGSKAKQAAVSVAGSAAITKTITMPATLSEAEVEEQIQIEADQYIPYPLEEINLDFEMLGLSEGNEETQDILLAASKSEHVDARVDAAERAGLTSMVVDIEPYAIEHTIQTMSHQLIDHGKEKTIAVFDIGASMTCLNVIHDMELIYTREQTFGGKQLTEEIMRRYGLSYEDAGKAKREGGLPSGYQTEVLDPFKTTLARQVSRFLQFFFSASAFSHIDQIVLSGGCASIGGIDSFIESHTGTPTLIAAPFASMKIKDKSLAPKITSDAPALMIACGLALRSFD